MRSGLLLAVALASPPASAQDGLGSAPDCGGDAFSSAQVIEHRPARKGPIVATPQTLCADLAPQQPPARVDIYANPLLSPENGADGGIAPYEPRSPRSGGPLRPPRP